MKMHTFLACCCLLGLMLGSCTPSPLAPRVTNTSTPYVVADTFFTGCAYFDSNTNGEIDQEDVLLGGLRFVITLADGTDFAHETSDSHCALAAVPTALPADAWPVVARIELPEGTPYAPIGLSVAILEYPDKEADFLFGVP